MSIFTEAERDRLLKAAMVEGELSQDQIAAKAAKTPEELLRVFDTLKPKQLMWVALNSVMGMSRRDGGEYTLFKAGRRSTSKKYGVESITLMPESGPAPSAFAAYKLYKRGDKISAAHGNMHVGLVGIYVP